MPTIPHTGAARPWITQGHPFERPADKDNHPFYNSIAWRRFRRWYLMQHPLCVECSKEGQTTSASVVDHITPINEGGAHLDEANVQALCARHHNIKSAREAKHLK